LGWVGLLQATHNDELVQSGILSSAEFFNRAQGMGFGGTPEQNYVQALSHVLLGRSGSPAEVAAWVGGLPGMGLPGGYLPGGFGLLPVLERQEAALGFLDSLEYRTDAIEGYYNALLHRPADAMGLNGWVNSGLDLLSVRIGFESSAEFFTNG
jgi:hypothetical protein